MNKLEIIQARPPSYNALASQTEPLEIYLGMGESVCDV